MSGRRITWNVYGIQFTGTVIREFIDIGGTTMLAVDVDNTSTPASVFPPGSKHGNGQWID